VRQAASANYENSEPALRERRAFVALAVTVATLLVLAVVIIPPLLAGGDDTENDVRSTLLQGLAGLFLAAGLYFTAQTLRHNRESAARTFELEREGQITERFTRAIDQLGHEKLDVRLGAIYALERIAWDSDREHEPIVEILTAFLREHADKTRGSPGDPSKPPSFENSRADVTAALEVIGRRADRGERHQLDLRRIQVKGAHLEDANLRKALLNGAELQWTYLQGADLSGAILSDADLRCSDCRSADMRDTWLDDAKLDDVKWDEAVLDRALLHGASYDRTKLSAEQLARAIEGD
jgi:Pentapeptide repeats (8 copies)